MPTKKQNLKKNILKTQNYPKIRKISQKKGIFPQNSLSFLEIPPPAR